MLKSKTSIALVGLLTLAAGPAAAVTYDLCAGPFNQTMPDGTVVPMWGFAPGGATGGVCDAPPTAPGPMLTVPDGDNVLTINLVNTLPNTNGAPTPVSVVVPGQITAMEPQRNPDGRVRSFTHETLPGTPGVYTWSNFTPGTYIYHSGSHPAVQVQMGLYGGVKRDSGPGVAYPGVGYDAEVVMFYSELDPDLHAAVASDDYGPGKGTTSTLYYHPQYFLINGAPYVDGVTPDLAGAPSGQRTLIRFLNAGLKTHVPEILGRYMSIKAEDGKAYPYPREQFSLQLPAMKTKDAVVVSDSRYPIYDRAMALTNGTGAGPGGMLRFVALGSPSAADTVTILRTRHDSGTSSFSVWADSSAAGAGTVLSLQGYGDMTYAADPDFGYSIAAAGVVTNPGSATVNSSLGGSDSKAVPYTAPPVASADAASVDEGASVNVPAAGVLANDSKGGYFGSGEALAAVLVTPPSNGTVTLNADGSFSYTHNGSETTVDSFTYRVDAIDTGTSTTLASSSPATVTVTVNPVNDTPVAVADAVTTADGTAVVVPVLSNDTDADGDPLSVTAVTQGTSGTVSLVSGTVTYTPTAPGPYTDSFTYTVDDGNGGTAVGTVTVTVEAAVNQPPVASDDAGTVTRNKRNTSPPNSVTIDVLANDSDADGSLVPSTVQVTVPPAHAGTVSVNPSTGAITYTPPVNFRGTDVFKYTVQDDAGATSNAASVNVNVVR